MENNKEENLEKTIEKYPLLAYNYNKQFDNESKNQSVFVDIGNCNTY